MLNWDEYGKEENPTPPVATEVKTEPASQSKELQSPKKDTNQEKELSLIHI